MPERPISKFRPRLERLEAKQPLSASVMTARAAIHEAPSRDLASPPAVTSAQTQTASDSNANSNIHSAINARAATTQIDQKPSHGFLVYRITNPDRYNNKLTPPFRQVLVQSRQPVPGQVYNVLQISVRNGTSRTFDASSRFRVRFPGQHASIPVLQPGEQWKPGQVYVFYVLTKQYYPLPSQVHSGFEFQLGGARSVAVPGPSAIFLRLKYNPSTFAKTLDWIVAHGPGTQGGQGLKFGLPVTSIYEFLAADTRRIDFGGYF